MAALTAIDRIGTTIGGRYELRRLIGEGGFSTVFSAVHVVTGREVAVKILHAHLTATEQVAQRFLMEARAMARVQHEGIVQVLDAGTDPDGRVYIALELLEGESLERTLMRERTLPWQTVVSHCIDVLDALAEAHKHGIIHRDIKPGNIFIVSKPGGATRARLLDFGIAHVNETKGKLTAEGLILGTPEYMSPEQGRTSNVGPASDLWSVGIVMWECLTGQTPYMGSNSTDILVKIATTDAPPIQSEMPDLPSAVATVIDKSLARDLAHRFRSAEEMRDALQRAVRRVAEPSRAPRPKARSPGVLHPGDERWAPAPTDVVKVDVMASFGLSEPGRPVAPVVSGDAGARVSRPPTLPPVSERRDRPSRSDRSDPGERTSSPPLAATSSSPSPPPSRASSPSIASTPSLPTSQSRGSSPGRGGRGVSAATAQARVEVTFNDDSSEASRQRVSQLIAATSEPPAPTGSTPPDLSEVRRAEAPLAPLDMPELTQAEREARTFSGTRATFRSPPTEVPRKTPRVALWAAIGVACLSAVVVFSLLRSRDPEPRREVVTDETPPDSAPPRRERPARLTLTSLDDAQLPAGAAGTEAAAEFVRHATVSNHAGGTLRMIASCVPDPAGATLYARTMTPGPLRASERGLIACAGDDMGIVSDVTSDGTDDIVGVGSRGGQLAVIDGATLRLTRAIDIAGLRSIARGTHIRLRGEAAVVTFSEPDGPSSPTLLQAVGAASGRVIWQVRGDGSAARIGDPSTLGLAVGPDTDGDGVEDVVAGVGEANEAGVATQSERRCVQAFSGADGHALWARPWCHDCALGPQSLSLGPDVSGDARGDVAVSCGVASGPAVVLLSGASGGLLREVATPAQREGFGESVTLLGDVDGDRAPDLVVGARSALLVLDAATGATRGALERPGLMRAFPVVPLVDGAAWSLAVASQAEGIRVYSRRESDDPHAP